MEFLLKIVLNIQQIWLRFCSCKKVSDRCSTCQFYAPYKEQQYKIYENLLNLDFIERFHSHIVRNLQILRKEDTLISPVSLRYRLVISEILNSHDHSNMEKKFFYLITANDIAKAFY